MLSADFWPWGHGNSVTTPAVVIRPILRTPFGEPEIAVRAGRDALAAESRWNGNSVTTPAVVIRPILLANQIR